MGSEAALMRECGHLYASIALESLATTLLAIIFSYLLLLITNKGRLASPGQAAWAFVVSNIKTFFRELWDEVKNWPQMKNLPLDRRFALCRKVNQAVCLFQILIAVLTVERWLHINNINGFRYLGYSITCPPMQSELIILVAPAVPCYRVNIVTTYFVTMLMLWAGYAASMMPTELYDGSISAYLETMDLADLKPNTKTYFTVVAMVAQVYLSFIQIPMLYIRYRCYGGEKAGLPHGYGKLLLNVSVSWLAFPVWWLLSYEGMNMITDTKMNAAGFCVLNILSKGSFTLQMLSITGYHRRMAKQKELIEQGQHPTLEKGKSDLFQDVAELPRRESKKETWVVKVLRPFDKKLDKPGAEAWGGLETTYRAYLVGIGMRGKKWNRMSVDDRLALRKDYDGTFNEILGECGNDEEDENEVEEVEDAELGKGSFEGSGGPAGLRAVDEAAPVPDFSIAPPKQGERAGNAPASGKGKTETAELLPPANLLKMCL